VPDLEAHYADLKRTVEATIAARTTAEWEAVLTAAGVPASRVALPLEILDDPQPAANAMLARQDHPVLGTLTLLGSPVHLDGGGFQPSPATPPFGSETRAILAWAGFGEGDVERLVAGGAVTRTPTA
jgi:formyl-CoA transferase